MNAKVEKNKKEFCCGACGLIIDPANKLLIAKELCKDCYDLFKSEFLVD